jgi:predicted dehydrogenase
MRSITRVAVVGVDHWHAEMHINALKEAGRKIVGVSAQREEAADQWGTRLGCPVWADLHRLVEETQPDFVVAMAQHADLAAVGGFLLQTGIPFAIEKPLGLNSDQVAPLAEVARRKRSFAAVPLVNRYSPIWQHVDALRSSGRLGDIAHAHFRIINGPPSRYNSYGVPWMLDPVTSGGGSLRNLGVHVVDAFLYLTGEDVEIVGSDIGFKLYGKPVEEFATAILRSTSGVIGTIEAGYTFASMSDGDYEWRIATAGAYLIDRAGELSVFTLDAEPVRFSTPPLQERYRDFMVDTLSRAEQGAAPIASIEDCYRAMLVIDKIYLWASRG